MNSQGQMHNGLLCVTCDSLSHRSVWLMDACRLSNGLGVQSQTPKLIMDDGDIIGSRH